MIIGGEDELIFAFGLFLCGAGLLASGIKYSHCKSLEREIDWVITFTAFPFLYLAWFLLMQSLGVDVLHNELALFYSRFAILMVGLLSVAHHLNGRVNKFFDYLLDWVVRWMHKL